MAAIIKKTGTGICIARGILHWESPLANELAYPIQFAKPKPIAIIIP